MSPVLTVAGTELRRFLRDRSNIFFVFIFPLLLVVVLGLQFGEGASAGRVAVAGEVSGLRETVVAELESQDVVVSFADEDALREQVARGRTDVGLVLPDGAGAAYDSGAEVTLESLTSGQSTAIATQQEIRTALAGVQLEQGQARALAGSGLDGASVAAALDVAREQTTAPTLRIEDVDELAQEFAGLGRFDLGATSQLLLFVFLTSLAGSTTLIQARRYGVISRALSAPVSTRQVLLGEAAGRLTIAVFQGVYIMVATALLFGVDWGNLWLSGLVLLVFSAVAAGAAMLLGSVLDNNAAASGVGVGLGLVLAGLGGGMAPLEVFPDTMRQVAHVTPHAWAYEAFAEIQRHDGGLLDILPQLGVLAAMALVLLLAGGWALRRSLARAM
ncbi:MAG: ABC transporter permease [Actinomycetota bacterium]|nr:ABC transporter permease [Actinomycetota bacterium]